jgi:hypothetical protein
MQPVENALIHNIGDALRRSTRLHVEQETRTDTSKISDGVLRIFITDEQPLIVQVDVKASIDRRDQILTFKNRHGSDTLLATGRMSAELAQYCRENDVMFADAAGNCYLQNGRFLIFILGQKREAQSSLSKEVTVTPATLRVMLAVLTSPELLNLPVRELAKTAGISHGAGGKALETLRELGLYVDTGTVHRMLAKPERWLDIWTEGYLARIRPKLMKRRMRSTSMEYALQHVSPAMGEVELGGEAAASRLGYSLSPGELTLYVNMGDAAILPELVRELRLRADPSGPIEITELFWNSAALQSFPCAPAPLIYADLVSSANSRNLEIAQQLRTAICERIQGQS